MSLRIIKAGMLDTIQDTGRFGYQSSGINPGGAMDRFSAQLANCLLGKAMDSPVIEMHFPAPLIRFEKAAVICLTGADFYPCVIRMQCSNSRKQGEEHVVMYPCCRIFLYKNGSTVIAPT